ncbi:3-keto-disaccharide hydrolase [Mucilaginibacter lappiensis]|uniref:3-keto-disaccharide hydrolase n=1 Tax=Mucilaginibacter lappiensis TaxID=354630 RepID=UPI003D25434C
MRNLSMFGNNAICRFFCMQIILTLFVFSTVKASAGETEPKKDPDVIGRWDLTITKAGKSLPSWLEVQKSGTHTLIGRFVYAFGSARPISKVKPDNGKYSFSIPPQWEEGSRNMDFQFEVSGDKIKGTMVFTDGVTYEFTGVRAPLLIKYKSPVWGTPVKLFNGKNVKGWHADGKNQWIAEGGILRSPHSGANLISDKTFTDFKLHIEFRYPQGSNSGVYLRGRYELQIIDTKSGDPEPINNQFSSIYGFLPPNKMMAKNPGEWQSYDVTLVGRMITIVANGKTVICDQVIPGITGGAINSQEGEPGPILIQGDHGPIDYRNIVITPVK